MVHEGPILMGIEEDVLSFSPAGGACRGLPSAAAGGGVAACMAKSFVAFARQLPFA